RLAHAGERVVLRVLALLELVTDGRRAHRDQGSDAEMRVERGVKRVELRGRQGDRGETIADRARRALDARGVGEVDRGEARLDVGADRGEDLCVEGDRETEERRDRQAGVEHPLLLAELAADDTRVEGLAAADDRRCSLDGDHDASRARADAAARTAVIGSFWTM